MAGGSAAKAGRGGKQGWTKHILAGKDEEGKPIKVIVFLRLEFQDGTHKEGVKRYEGSGRPHVHVLLFSDDMDKLKLEEFVSAALPAEAVLRGKAACSQRDREADYPFEE